MRGRNPSAVQIRDRGRLQQKPQAPTDDETGIGQKRKIPGYGAEPHS
jgi:hypothetical protein